MGSKLISPKAHDFRSCEEKQREILQALACSADSLATALRSDPDLNVFHHYEPLLNSCSQAIQDAYAVLED